MSPRLLIRCYVFWRWSNNTDFLSWWNPSLRTGVFLLLLFWHRQCCLMILLFKVYLRFYYLHPIRLDKYDAIHAFLFTSTVMIWNNASFLIMYWCWCWCPCYVAISITYVQANQWKCWWYCYFNSKCLSEPVMMLFLLLHLYLLVLIISYGAIVSLIIIVIITHILVFSESRSSTHNTVDRIYYDR